MKVRELERALFERFPACDAESWDHVGLSAGDPDATVGRVLCALDATEQTVAAAAARGANVVVAHHPVYLTAPSAFAPAGSERPACAAAVYAAIERGIALMSFHTNLDRSLEARRTLPARLGLEAFSSIEFPEDPARHGLGALCRDEGLALGELAARAARAFGTEPRVWGDPAQTPAIVAVLGGSLGDCGEAALQAGARSVVVGEAGYHVAQDLWLRGCSVVLLGHDRSEQPFATVLAGAVRTSGVPDGCIDILEPPRQWWTAGEGGRR